jgi:hypothetical protein
MKDYNLRSRDIYGGPQQRGGRWWVKLGVVLVVVAAAIVAFLQIRGHRAVPEMAPTPATNPDIIPLTLPPRTPARGPSGAQ